MKPLSAPQPLVSIVVPAYDRSARTRRCLEALAALRYPAFEVIVVDDGSTDDTPAMLAAFAAEHPELALTVLRNDVNRGANASRNRGTLAARGELVAYLDSDCVADPDWLDQIVRGFVADDVVAVTGLVKDPEPRSIYDVAFRGTNRVWNSGEARRIVAGNLCVRRGPLHEVLWDDRLVTAATHEGRPDVRISGRCDEESLFLELTARGYRFWVRPEAVVLHEHWYTRDSFFRQAKNGGRSAARLVYKYRLPQRLDMLPFMLAWGTLLPALALALAGWPLALVVPLVCFAGALAAVTYNDLVRKGKTLGQVVRTFPHVLAYYHLRLVGYVAESLRLRTRPSGIERVDLRAQASQR